MLNMIYVWKQQICSGGFERAISIPDRALKSNPFRCGNKGTVLEAGSLFVGVLFLPISDFVVAIEYEDESHRRIFKLRIVAVSDRCSNVDGTISACNATTYVKLLLLNAFREIRARGVEGIGCISK